MPRIEHPLKDIPRFTQKYAGGRAKHCTNGQLSCNDPDGYDIRVSDGVRERAARLFRTVIAECERRGMVVKNTQDHPRGTYCMRDGMRVAIVLREKTRMYRVKKEGHFGPKVVYVPNCELSLRVGDGLSREWRDRRRARLEDQVDGILEGVEKEFDSIVERDRRWRRDAEAAAQRAEEQQRLQEEQREIEALVAEAERWEKSRLVRRFVREVERQVKSPRGDLSAGAQQWADRALHLADRLDPLAR